MPLLTNAGGRLLDFNGGGPISAIYKTTDARKLEKLTKGLPYENGGDTGRIGLDIYRKDTNIVYVIVQHEKGGTYGSEDKGETWKKMGDTIRARRTTARFASTQ